MIGYAYLLSQIPLRMPPLAQPARLRAVTRIEEMDRLRAWAADPRNAQVLDRVMGWACLSETRDSYAIENEMPSPDKERAFLQAMSQLRERLPSSEDYLVGLQNLVISRALKAEAAFRSSGSGRTACACRSDAGTPMKQCC